MRDFLAGFASGIFIGIFITIGLAQGTREKQTIKYVVIKESQLIVNQEAK